jgi:hypothetical protein
MNIILVHPLLWIRLLFRGKKRLQVRRRILCVKPTVQLTAWYQVYICCDFDEKDAWRAPVVLRVGCRVSDSMLLLRDRYDKVLRPSFFQWTREIEKELARFKVTFIHCKNEGQRTLSYLSRNTLPDTKSSCPDTEFHSGISSTSSGISSGRIYQRHVTSVSEMFATGFSYKEISEFRTGKILDFYPQWGLILRPTSRVPQIWPLG